ncbi:MAG: pantoate--beta-alanine ligase [Flavobacteriales bacterium]
MQIFRTSENLREFVDSLRKENKKIGFVPTMGALHFGHKSLIERAYEACDWVICSIFVNPTQFNDKTDLDKYPRTLEADIALLSDFHDKLIIYNPEVSEMYPEHLEVEKVDFGYITSVLEAEFRPGHFDGMVDIVRRLLSHANADVAFFGEKDYQQLAIIRKFVRDENIPTAIIGCPIVREKDGLAMSSRNARLSLEDRTLALNINKALSFVKNAAKTGNIADTLEEVKTKFFAHPNMRLEYIECVDSQTLEICETWNDTFEMICCVAIYVGDVRLIDNMLVKP